MAYQLICDGGCDLTKEQIEANNLHVIPFYISFDKVKYEKEIEEIGIREVYERMVGNTEVIPKTSLPSIQDYADAFERFAKEGKDIICFCMTVTLSGSYNSACNAKEIVLEKYPDVKIEVINSKQCTVTEGLILLEAAKMQKAGWSYEHVLKGINKLIPTGRIFFTVGNTDYLRAGGRIGKVASAATNLLSLKPIIVLKDGEISADAISRGRNKSMVKVFEVLQKHFENCGENPEDYEFSVGFGYDIEEGRKYFEMFKEYMKKYSSIKDTLLVQIGATVSVHTGPHAIGVGLMKKFNCLAIE